MKNCLGESYLLCNFGGDISYGKLLRVQVALGESCLGSNFYRMIHCLRCFHMTNCLGCMLLLGESCLQCHFVGDISYDKLLGVQVALGESWLLWWYIIWYIFLGAFLWQVAWGASCLGCNLHWVKVAFFVYWVLWHINVCWLFNAKSIFMWIIFSF